MGQLSWRKEAKDKKPWPNFPLQLLSYIGSQPELINNISYPGTIKALRLASRRCQNYKNPELAELVDVGIFNWSAQPGTTKRYVNIHFLNEFYVSYRNGSHHEFCDPKTLPVYNVGCGYNTIIARLSSPSKYVLRLFGSRCSWILPDWDVNIPFKFAVYYELFHLVPKGCLLVLTGISNPAFTFYRQNGENVWLKRDCTITDPNYPRQQFMRFGTAIACRGKIYALSMQGTIAVIELVNSDLSITAISRNRAVPSVNARYFRECLMESNGEILLIFLIFQKTMSNVDRVEVYKLEVPKLRWVKMEELGDRSLFLEPESCIWVKASKAGCQSNCVFFSTTIDEWWTYDLKSGTISSGLSKNVKKLKRSPTLVVSIVSQSR